jgi:hypothetical protein
MATEPRRPEADTLPTYEDVERIAAQARAEYADAQAFYQTAMIDYQTAHRILIAARKANARARREWKLALELERTPPQRQEEQTE